MRQLGRRLAYLSLALLALGLAGQARALTFTLQQVIDVGGFTTPNGLEFADFDTTIAGDLALAVDNNDLLLTILLDGFQLTGPLSAADGESGDLLLSFSVTAQALANGINGAALLANGVADGAGARTAVEELISGSAGGPVLGVLSAFDTGATPGDGVFSDAISFAPQLSIRVVKDIVVDSVLIGGGSGGSARISFVEQHFTVVPEPGTAALLGLGVAGLGVVGRSKRQESKAAA